jgi:6-pyruvoyltetrahydropterin/6-carboxytetrahydropterin synthase
MSAPLVRVRRRFRFEAAHRLPRHPGKCRELHGHSYALLVTVELPVDPESGMGIDFADLKAIVRREVVDHLDHRCVNDLIENPTAELMAEWMWRRLVEHLPGLVEIELHETEDSSVVYRGG